MCRLARARTPAMTASGPPGRSSATSTANRRRTREEPGNMHSIASVSRWPVPGGPTTARGAVRPAHGFALQAIGLGGATATETGRRLGISKQAAGKTIDRLEELGYVRRSGDDADRRRKLARLTPRGVEVLALSAMIFEDIRSRWAGTLGAGRLAELESGLRTMVPGETFRLDVPGWFGA